MTAERDRDPPPGRGVPVGPRRANDPATVSPALLARAPLPSGPAMLLATGPDVRPGPDSAPREADLPAGGFPDPTTGPLLVLYQRHNGQLGLRWRLDPAALAAAAGAFHGDAGAALVARLRRVNNPDASVTLPLSEAAVDGTGEAAVPPGSGDLQAEVGYAGSQGGWLLVARSNPLDLIAPVGVAFLRGSGEEPAVAPRADAQNARTGFGWAATISADARARTARNRVATADALGAVARTPHSDAPPGAVVGPAAAPVVGPAATPVVGPAAAPPLVGPFPLWRPGATPVGWQGAFAPAEPPASTADSPAGEAPPRPAPGRPAGTDPAGSVLPAARYADPEAPPDLPERVPSAVPVHLRGLAEPPQPEPEPPLPTRGLRLPLPGPGEPDQTIADTPTVPTADGAQPDHHHGDAAPRPPVSGSGPVIRPGASTATTLYAELLVYGSAAPGSLVDLGGHAYQVGPGGRFVLRVPLADRDLILGLLAQQPALPVTARDQGPP